MKPNVNFLPNSFNRQISTVLKTILVMDTFRSFMVYVFVRYLYIYCINMGYLKVVYNCLYLEGVTK